MRTAARHEAAHAVACHLLGLTEILQPVGAVCRRDGSGGFVRFDSQTISLDELKTLGAEMDFISSDPCEYAVNCAREHPDAAQAIVLFLLAGFGVESELWSRGFSETCDVRVSSDFKTARNIILNGLGKDDWDAHSLASRRTRDALDAAAAWARLPHVRALIDQVADYLEGQGAVTWAEISKLFFSGRTDNATADPALESVRALGENPLDGVDPGAVAVATPTAAAEIQRVENQSTEGEEMEIIENAHE